MAEQINYYEVLGVSRNASRSEIKNAYRRLAKDRHPDRPGGSETEFSRLQEAYAVLSDPNRRRRHDEALDLAHAADQLAGVIDVDWDKLEDELSQKRRERESRGGGGGRPGLGERLRNKFRREEAPDLSGGRASPVRGRSGASARSARWYEPHDFDPDPINWRTGALSFVGTFLAFIVVGQIGRWAVGMDAPPVFATWATALGPFMFLFYTLAGLLGAYFAYRAAGWAAVALVFVAALVVGGSGGPPGLTQFATAGIVVLLAVVYLGGRRARANWRERR
jgi:molecular chaperone DnaJ